MFFHGVFELLFFHIDFELLFFHITCVVLSEVFYPCFSCLRRDNFSWYFESVFFRVFYLEVLVLMFLMLAVVVEVGGNL